MDKSKIYLQPLGILRGCNAIEAVKAGHARWLVGGPLAFTIAKIIFRESALRISTELMPVVELDKYISKLAVFQQDSLLSQLDNICQKRRYFQEGRPLLQGIVNVTPDSFSDGGQYNQRALAASRARELIAEGADIIDIGGESTRPGAQKVSVEVELSRVIPVIESLSDISVPISIDTRNAKVMEEALRAGATIVNDVSALSYDEKSLAVVAASNCLIILMHAQNAPDNMQDNPRYDDVVLDVYDFLERRLEICMASGIERRRIIIDPGIGFGKTVDHNSDLLANLSLFHGLGVPLLLGVSRKSFIGHICGGEGVAQRLAGSLSFGQAGYDQGVQILRVHDIKESRQAREAWARLAG
ncbi:Dihydropteroate synthase [hydrothermal vent metagenome]|uniref:dihydropteroate synthase n=1 Tax=hydrothermal vent metagenome TaxID=652676 RepID=A0A3B1AQ54_9ZZZZ